MSLLNTKVLFLRAISPNILDAEMFRASVEIKVNFNVFNSVGSVATKQKLPSFETLLFEFNWSD